MSRRVLYLVGVAAASVAVLGASCVSKNHDLGLGGANAGQGGATASTTTTTGGTAGGVSLPVGSGSSTGSGCPTCPTCDLDNDGWTPAEGDCNDCDPNVNPGAIDVAPTANADGGIPEAIDEDCDGLIDPPVPCDANLALDDETAGDAVKAIDLCKVTTLATRQWGVLSSRYVGADGVEARTPGTQAGLRASWGANVAPLRGKSMLGLASGFMRTPGEPGYQTVAHGSSTVINESWSNGTLGPPPAGFPQAVPNCPVATDIYNDIALEVTMRAPSNATGYKFNFKFQSFEYPEWVCTSYNDQFVALVSPAPTGSINGNISFDGNNNPVSVNIAYFDVCNASAAEKAWFAYACLQSSHAASCPTPPNPYCPAGISELVGTGLDGVAGCAPGCSDPAPHAGGTSWLETTAPVTPGQPVTIRFAIWDTGDAQYNSSVLIDAFEWIATPGAQPTPPPPVVQTSPPQ